MTAMLSQAAAARRAAIERPFERLLGGNGRNGAVDAIPGTYRSRSLGDARSAASDGPLCRLGRSEVTSPTKKILKTSPGKRAVDPRRKNLELTPNAELSGRPPTMGGRAVAESYRRPRRRGARPICGRSNDC